MLHRIASPARGGKPRRRAAPTTHRTSLESLESRAVLSGAPFVAVRLVASGDEATGTDTVFELRRTGGINAPLAVNVALAGSALPKVDYIVPDAMQAGGGMRVTIPANQATARVALPTRSDLEHDPNETVALVVQPGADYRPMPAADRAVALLAADGVAGTTVAAALNSANGWQFRNKTAFAAIRSDGSVVAWGNAKAGGSAVGIDFDGPRDNLTVKTIVSSHAAFAAIRSDGSVVAWGDAAAGGDASAVDFDGPRGELSVTRIVSSGFAFAALRSDGSVVTWGGPAFGGNASGIDFNGPRDDLAVTQLVAANGAFAALRSNGSVVTWGEWAYGGDSSGVDFNGPRDDLAVTRLVAAGYGFAAVRSDGSVVTWGSIETPSLDFDGPLGNLTVREFFSTSYAFAALRSDGSVLAWGDPEFGGDATGVDFDGPNNDLTVTNIFSGDSAFAALRSDGSVVTWGGAAYGGDSSRVAPGGLSGAVAVTDVVSNGYAFAAVRSDGSVVSWGVSGFGGSSAGVDFDGPANNLRVTQITSTGYAFAALRNDGSVVTWGGSSYGGSTAGIDLDGPANNLKVTGVFSTEYAFAAIRDDGSVVTWGAQSSGGSSAAVDFDGPRDTLRIVTIASPSLQVRASVLSLASAPTIISAVSGNGSARLHFTPPTSDGGLAITNYAYSIDGGATFRMLNPATTASPVTISGLVNGLGYRILLRAVTAAGTGLASAAVSVKPVTTPAAPVITAVARGNGTAAITFTAPASDGGAAITNYAYSLDGGVTYAALSPSATGSPLTIGGLVNRNGYQLRLRAVNAAGSGAASGAFILSPVTVPSAPVITSVTRGDRSATIAFATPTSNGGAAISNYAYSINGGATFTPFAPARSGSPVTIAGLVNGVTYQVRLRALNALGAGAASAAVAVTPAATPAAPVIAAVARGNGSATLVFRAPASTGGAAITGYLLSTDGGATYAALRGARAGVAIPITGLVNGIGYALRLRAVNAMGAGAASAAVLVTPATTPSVPVITAVTPRSGSAVITFAAPSGNGAAITSYVFQVSMNAGATWATLALPPSAATTTTVTGLVNGRAYWFRVAAVNSVGRGVFSQPSMRTTPLAAYRISATP